MRCPGENQGQLVGLCPYRGAGTLSGFAYCKHTPSRVPGPELGPCAGLRKALCWRGISEEGVLSRVLLQLPCPMGCCWKTSLLGMCQSPQSPDVLRPTKPLSCLRVVVLQIPHSSMIRCRKGTRRDKFMTASRGHLIK